MKIDEPELPKIENCILAGTKCYDWFKKFPGESLTNDPRIFSDRYGLEIISCIMIPNNEIWYLHDGKINKFQIEFKD